MSRKKPNRNSAPAPAVESGGGVGRAEILIGVVLSCWIVLLHALFLFHAGPLWRDEVGTIDFASMPTVSDIWQNLQYDNFPPLFLAVARAWTMAGLSGDFNYRLLGFLIGVGTVGLFWFGARRGGARAPLLALALYAVNPLAVRVGDSMRPYGLGIALNLLDLFLTWKYVEKPRLTSWLWAAVAAVLSVQCLYQNALFVAAFCVAGGVVALARRQWKIAVRVVGLGFVAALSLLPHLENIRKGRDWGGIAWYPVHFQEILKTMEQAVNAAGSGLEWCWAALAILALAAGLSFALRRRNWQMLYFTVALLAAAPFYLLFLENISLQPRSWYFLILLAPSALAMDLVLAGLLAPRAVVARPAAAVLLALMSIPAGFASVQVRQTNADLVAAALQHAGPGDVILVSPWYYGVALQRYYTNSFDTIPPMATLRIHRYDLMKQQMLAADPVGPLLEKVRQTLRSGQSLWVVGDFQFPPPGQPQPLLPPYRTDMVMDVPAAHYFSSWMFQFSQMVQTHATSIGQVDIPVPGGATVNNLENMPVFVFRGWKE